MKKILWTFVLILAASVCLADVAAWKEHMDGPEKAFILWTPVLTATLEVFVLWLFKYRKRALLIYFAILNLISNVLLNLLLNDRFPYAFPEFCRDSLDKIRDILSIPLNSLFNFLVYLPIFGFVLPLFILEICVVLFEFGLFGLKAGYSKKLFFIILLCNVVSFMTGIGLMILSWKMW